MPAPHGLALAAVDAELEHAHAAAVTRDEAVEHLARAVGGAVVHEEHVDARILEETSDLTDVQPRGLVVAGDRQPHRGASMSRAAGTRALGDRERGDACAADSRAGPGLRDREGTPCQRAERT
jgi:hypothetical protein